MQRELGPGIAARGDTGRAAAAPVAALLRLGHHTPVGLQLLRHFDLNSAPSAAATAHTVVA